MFVKWMNINELEKTENKYKRGCINKENLKKLCEKYNFTKVTYGWMETKTVKNIPNVRNNKIHEYAPEIRMYFDHFYSFKNKDGEIYWVIAPYSYGVEKEEIERIFRENYVVCDILDGFYADYAIVIKPEDMVDACYRYGVCKNQNKKYSLYKYSNCLDIVPKAIGEFETEGLALAYKDEILNAIKERCK